MFALMCATTAMAQKIPASAIPLNAEEQQIWVDRLKVAESKQTAKRMAPLGNETPMFIIDVNGNAEDGIRGKARNSGIIPKGSIVIGAKKYPGKPTEYMWAYNISESLPANSLWYELEKHREGVSTEQGGVAVFKMIVYAEGTMSEYIYEKNFQNYSQTAARQTIVDDSVIYNASGEPTSVVLYGNFVGSVAVHYRNTENGLEDIIDPVAISHDQNMITIDISKLKYFSFQAGDYSFTVADGTRFSVKRIVKILSFEEARKANKK